MLSCVIYAISLLGLQCSHQAVPHEKLAHSNLAGRHDRNGLQWEGPIWNHVLGGVFAFCQEASRMVLHQTYAVRPDLWQCSKTMALKLERFVFGIEGPLWAQHVRLTWVCIIRIKILLFYGCLWIELEVEHRHFVRRRDLIGHVAGPFGTLMRIDLNDSTDCSWPGEGKGSLSGLLWWVVASL